MGIKPKLEIRPVVHKGRHHDEQRRNQLAPARRGIGLGWIISQIRALLHGESAGGKRRKRPARGKAFAKINRSLITRFRKKRSSCKDFRNIF
jgi:hypothetical protein